LSKVDTSRDPFVYDPGVEHAFGVLRSLCIYVLENGNIPNGPFMAGPSLFILGLPLFCVRV
jgi:hypothetical protein